jgi:hypothetical protein
VALAPLQLRRGMVGATHKGVAIDHTKPRNSLKLDRSQLQRTGLHRRRPVQVIVGDRLGKEPRSRS